MFLQMYSISPPLVHLVSHFLLSSDMQSLNSKYFQHFARLIDCLFCSLLQRWSWWSSCAVLQKTVPVSFLVHTIFQDCVDIIFMPPPDLFDNVRLFPSHSLLLIWWILKIERKLLYPHNTPSWTRSTYVSVSKKIVWLVIFYEHKFAHQKYETGIE